MKRVYSYIITIAFLCLTVVSGYPHSGRTDRNGGHHDRKNGGYHYHNSGTVRRQSVTPRQTETKRVWVNGYYRKDGTYVRGHYRTAPDGNPTNNYSFPGNYNPNTGKITPGNPQTYLDRYYNKSNTSPPPSTSGEYNSHDVPDTQTQVQAQPTTDDLQQIKTEEQQLSEQTQQVQTLTPPPSNVQSQYAYTPTGQDTSSDTSSAAAIIIIIVVAFIFYYLRPSKQI